jgi:hypothetical protein
MFGSIEGCTQPCNMSSARGDMAWGEDTLRALDCGSALSHRGIFSFYVSGSSGRRI